jgi:hypothetical protein
MPVDFSGNRREIAISHYFPLWFGAKRLGAEDSCSWPGVLDENCASRKRFPSHHRDIEIMIDPIPKRLNQNLALFDATDVMFHFDPKA